MGWEDVADVRDGHDFFVGLKTTGRKPGPEHVVKDAHRAGVLRPCLRGRVECRYHEREVQDTRPRNPGKHSPNVPIASASRAPAPSSAGEAVTDLRSASSVRID